MKKLSIVLALLATPCYSSDFIKEINVGAVSYHPWHEGFVDEDGVFKEYNEVNPSIGVTLKNNMNVTLMKNSEYNPSVIIAYNYERQIAETVSFAARVGVVTGYIDMEVAPFAHLATTAWYGNHGVELGLMQFAAFTLQYRYKF